MNTHSAQYALARSRAYDLFGRLYLQGLTDELWPIVQRVPELTDATPEVFDADKAAADHYRLFGLNVFPYASLYLDDEGRIGGPVTDYVRHQFRQIDLGVDLSQESADHLGHELIFLGFIASAEADAWGDSTDVEVARMQHIQRHFLDRHLSWWLPVFAHAVRRQKYSFYTTLADLTLELVLDHRAALDPDVAESLTPALGTPPKLLDDQNTGLKDIAEFLSMPAWCGVCLSRDDIARLGRSERIPRGFGGRTRMLANLLRSAAEFDRLESVMNRLLDWLEDWRTHYCALRKNSIPCMEAVADFWLERVENTTHMVQRLQTAAGGVY